MSRGAARGDGGAFLRSGAPSLTPRFVSGNALVTQCPIFAMSWSLRDRHREWLAVVERLGCATRITRSRRKRVLALPTHLVLDQLKAVTPPSLTTELQMGRGLRAGRRVRGPWRREQHFQTRNHPAGAGARGRTQPSGAGVGPPLGDAGLCRRTPVSTPHCRDMCASKGAVSQLTTSGGHGGGRAMNLQDDCGAGNGSALVHDDPLAALDVRPEGGAEGTRRTVARPPGSRSDTSSTQSEAMLTERPPVGRELSDVPHGPQDTGPTAAPIAGHRAGRRGRPPVPDAGVGRRLQPRTAPGGR